MSLNMPKTPEKQSAAALGAPKLDWDLERYSLFDRLKAAAHELDLDISFPVEDPPPPDPAILRRKIRQLLSRHHAPPAILTTTADGETVAPLLDSPRPEEEADAGPPSPEPVYAHDSLSPPRLKDVQFNLSPDDLVDLYAKVSQSETLLTDYSAVLRFIVLVHLSRTASALCVDDLLNPGWNAELLWVQSTMDSLQHCDGLRDFHQAVMATYEEKEEARLAAGEFDYERVSRKRWTEMRDFIHVFGEVLEGKCRSALFEEVDRVKLHFRALCDMDPRKDAQDEEWLVQYAWPAPGLRSYCETFGWKHHDDEDLLYKEYEDEHEEEEEEEDEEDDDWDQYEAAPMSTPRKYALHSPPPLDFDDGSSSSDNPERPLDDLEKIGDEIEGMENAMLDLKNMYQIVDKLGEGTFSTVYKAIDLQHHRFDNSKWRHEDEAKPPKRSKVYVALKKIYVTSSPERIYNELNILEKLRTSTHIAYLIEAWRHQDQVMAVMPYSRHQDFREYYRKIPLCDLKHYFRCLFKGLLAVHEERVIHRDVKPANFLYDPVTGHGVLCDFGLAETFHPHHWRGQCHHTVPTGERPHGEIRINRDTHSLHLIPGGALGPKVAAKKPMMGPPERVGYPKEDQRPQIRANRAGTRGFRAPEVLFKCMDQTVAIDIWSAGVIMLAFLTKRFPLFNANDDNESLLEIATIFGAKRMQQCALMHNRTFKCTIPSVVDTHTHRIPEWIATVNPGLWDPKGQPNREAYLNDVDMAVDLCKKCLHLDCTKRSTAKELLLHPFLDDVRQIEDTL